MRRCCKYCGAIYDGDKSSVSCPACAKTHKKTTTAVRICLACGAAFPGGPAAKYCEDCRAERRRQQKMEAMKRCRAGTARHLGSTAYCIACGAPYTVASSSQRYCPDCAPEKLLEHDRAASRAWYAENANPEQIQEARRASAAPIACPICGELFIPVYHKKTCSPACAAELKRRSGKENYKKRKVIKQKKGTA